MLTSSSRNVMGINLPVNNAFEQTVPLSASTTMVLTSQEHKLYTSDLLSWNSDFESFKALELENVQRRQAHPGRHQVLTLV